jgi:hypothetical protein
VLEFAGDLGASGLDQFLDRLRREPLGPPSGLVVIDVADVGFVTTDELATLSAARRYLASTGRTLVLRNPQATFLALLHVSGLVGVMAIED